ncbi:MAG: deoxyguanosinetriphosphate triphosphohydrolase [Lachnospiraceae bacterium]|nr:deoxyguanosinetriphosphate triphosphohydrolase [Lachnospiraceae bacterium]
MSTLNLRKIQEEREHQILSRYAAFSDASRGRDRDEPACDIRPAYQRDRDRILHCKAFRRLMHKTQVFLHPEGDHYRTRLTHTLEVSQNARTIARALKLNEDLAEAIALGHDLGHTPFGHAGERALNEISKTDFCHSDQSVRVVEILEKHGEGLNLTWEVRDGIRNHRTSGRPATLEGKIVRLSDKIAYINADIDDAIRGQIIKEDDIPNSLRDILGTSTRNRLDRIIHDIVINSLDKDDIMMSKPFEEAIADLRKFMFKSVYTNKEAKGEEAKAEKMVKSLYEYYVEDINRLPSEYVYMIREMHENPHKVVCDYIAGMTDRYAVSVYKNLVIPFSWNVY